MFSTNAETILKKLISEHLPKYLSKRKLSFEDSILKLKQDNQDIWNTLTSSRTKGDSLLEKLEFLGFSNS